MEESRRVLVLVGSPRRDGNSATLARAVQRGAEAAGNVVALRFIDDHVARFLGDCRTCRGADGECGIGDGYRDLLFDHFLPAQGVVICTPIYWYGMSAQTKAFFDRMFCHYAAAAPEAACVAAGLRGKRIGLVLAAEETYPGAGMGIVHQLQEYARYTHCELVGVVRGTGNSRGEVTRDPADPVHAAEALGRGLFEGIYTDYRMDSPRANNVWPSPDHSD